MSREKLYVDRNRPPAIVVIGTMMEYRSSVMVPMPRGPIPLRIWEIEFVLWDDQRHTSFIKSSGTWWRGKEVYGTSDAIKPLEERIYRSSTNEWDGGS